MELYMDLYIDLTWIYTKMADTYWNEVNAY